MNPFITISITQKMYGWTKWGGAREGILKEDLDVWYCQSCGQAQLKELPSYMIPTDETGRDFARICSVCKANTIRNRILILRELLDSCR